MDTNAVLRAGTTDLTADETLTTFRVGPMNNPLWLIVVVPERSAADTLDVELEICDTSASTTQVQNMNMAQIVAAGVYQMPFWTMYEYLQVKLNVSANGTEDFGAVKVLISAGPVHPDGKQA